MDKPFYASGEKPLTELEMVIWKSLYRHDWLGQQGEDTEQIAREVAAGLNQSFNLVKKT